MDNPRHFQDNLLGPSASMLNTHKGSADGFSVQSGGLMRYHSAPSSTFATLLDSDFYPAPDSAELLQFLTQSGLGDFSSSGVGELSMKPILKQVSSNKKEQRQHVYSCQSDILRRHNGRVTASFPEHIGQGPLSAILEHAGEETCVSQQCQLNPSPSSSLEATIDSSSDQYKSNLIRHSSLPTDFLSRLATVDMSERPLGSQQVGSQQMQSTSQQVSSHMNTTSPRTTDNTGGKVYLVSSNLSPRGVPVRKCFMDEVGSCKEEEYGVLDSELNQYCGLLRQSSSPAGLLSQLTLDEFGNGTDKAAMSCTQGLVLGGWDETSMDSAMHKIAALGQRKRGREVDARLLKSLPAADLLMGALDHITSPSANHYSVVGASNGNSMLTDSVLCKSRAKRGFATHPRSIAERVRRTKISERIKKLQDLVPNLDKQAHTADMLDEVVEYVKLLQQRVKELSKHSSECNGTCQKGSISAEK